MSENLIYFSHDASARNDPKIKAIESIYGCEAYSWFFKTIEYMCQNQGQLEMNKYFFSIMPAEIGCPRNKVEPFINDCLNSEIGLFYSKEENGKKFIRSESLDRRIKKKQEVSAKARFAAKTKWENQDRPEKQKKIYEENSFELRTAKSIYEKFAKPKGAKEPNFQDWADTIRKIVQFDGKSESYVSETLIAVERHEGNGGFAWRDVILSPQKLRKQISAGAINPMMSSRGNRFEQQKQEFLNRER